MPDLLETNENGVTTLTLNRPERLNALSPAMTAGLKEALERLATDRECGAIVIAGAGRGWCAGGDVKTMECARPRPDLRGPGRGAAPRAPVAAADAHHPEGRHRHASTARRPAPGLGLALACDLRIAGKSARFGTAFARIGYSGDYGGTWSADPAGRHRQGARTLFHRRHHRRRGSRAARHRQQGRRRRRIAGRDDGAGAPHRRRAARRARLYEAQPVRGRDRARSRPCSTSKPSTRRAAPLPRTTRRRSPPSTKSAARCSRGGESDGRALFRGILRGPGVRARADPHRHRDGQRAVHDA